MNYRHAFHAGNFADVLKHVVLGAVLEQLLAKPAPMCVFDAHAGRGAYDLAASEATRSPEFVAGIGRLWQAPALPPLVAPYVERVRGFNRARGAHGLRFYPGSPCLARLQLRAEDRVVACELHPEDVTALRAELRGAGRTAVHHRDAWEALGALLPPAEKRGVVLIDPPYEPPAEDFRRVVAAFDTVRRRFANAVVLAWYPLKVYAPRERAGAGLLHRAVRRLRLERAFAVELCVRPDAATPGLNGSGVIVLNPPWQLEERLASELPALWRLLCPDGAGRAGLVSLAAP